MQRDYSFILKNFVSYTNKHKFVLLVSTYEIFSLFYTYFIHLSNISLDLHVSPSNITCFTAGA